MGPGPSGQLRVSRPVGGHVGAVGANRRHGHAEVVKLHATGRAQRHALRRCAGRCRGAPCRSWRELSAELGVSVAVRWRRRSRAWPAPPAPPGPSSLKLDESSVAGSSACEKLAVTALSGLMSVVPSTGERAVTCGASCASVAKVHAYGARHRRLVVRADARAEPRRVDACRRASGAAGDQRRALGALVVGHRGRHRVAGRVHEGEVRAVHGRVVERRRRTSAVTLVAHGHSRGAVERRDRADLRDPLRAGGQPHDAVHEVVARLPGLRSGTARRCSAKTPFAPSSTLCSGPLGERARQPTDGLRVEAR